MLDLDHLFKHHPPTDAYQIVQYQRIREAGKKFAQAVVYDTPVGADQTTAIRHIRDAVMTANAAIATNGRTNKE